MKKLFKKAVTMGLAAIMAVSAMSISAFAKEARYNEEGEIIGYEYSIDDVTDDKESVQSIRNGIQPLSLGTSVPGYNSTAVNLENEDYVDDFSVTSTLGSRDTVYTNLFTGTAKPFGIRFRNIENKLSAVTIKIYERTSTGSKLIDTWKPASSIIGTTILKCDSGKKYYMEISARTSSEGLKAGFTISNDIDSLFPEG